MKNISLNQRMSYFAGKYAIPPLKTSTAYRYLLSRLIRLTPVLKTVSTAVLPPKLV
jgi:hypothetical protein